MDSQQVHPVDGDQSVKSADEVRRLAAQVRRQRAIVFVLGLIVGWLLWKSQHPGHGHFDEVVTNQLRLVRANGDDAGRWYVDDDEHVYLGLFDTNGTARLYLSVSSVGVPSVTLGDDHNQKRLLLGVERNGTPKAWFLNAGGKNRITIGGVDNREPGVMLHDENGKPEAVFVTMEGQGPGLWLLDRDKQNRFVAEIGGDGFPAVSVGAVTGGRAVDWLGAESRIVFRDDEGLERLIIGRLPDGSYGVRTDVDSCEADLQLQDSQ